MIKPLIIIIFSLLGFSSTVKLSIDAKIRSIQSTNMNGNEFISAYSASKYLLPGSKFNSKENKIEAGDFDLYYYPNSFFIVKEDWNGATYYQLGLPVAEVKNRDFLPLRSFIFALDSMEIYDVATVNKGLNFTLVSKGQSLLMPLANNSSNSRINNSVDGKLKYTDTYSTDPFKDSFIENSKKLKEAFKDLAPKTELYESNVKENSSVTQKPKPGPYGLPKGLIRRELEELRKKD